MRRKAPAIAIRRVQREEDIRLLHEFFVEYEDDLPPALRHGVVPEAARLAATYRDRNAAFLATIGADAAGCVAVRALDAGTALLLRLYVRPKRRRQGAARRLASAAIDFARRREYHRIVLDTNKTQLAHAYRLYESLGFVECEPFAAVTYACPTFMERKLWECAHGTSRRSDSNR